MRQTKQLKAIAYHEAGHAVAAKYHGLAAKSLSIIPDQNSLGRYIHQPYFRNIDPSYDASPRAQRRIENMVIVSLAGPQAQRRCHPRGHWKRNAQGDWEQAVKLLGYLCGDEEEVGLYCALLDYRACSFLNEPDVWECIGVVADALLAHKELKGKQITEIIETHW